MEVPVRQTQQCEYLAARYLLNNSVAGRLLLQSPDIGESHLRRLHIMRAMGPPQKEKNQYNVVFTGHAGGELNVR